MTETLVVGASAAGAMTAFLVAASGRPVTLIDALADPGREERTLIVTDRLSSVVGPALTRSCIRGRVHRFEMFAAGALGEVQLQRPDLVIERSALVRDLLLAAKSAGARILPRHRFGSFAPSGQVRVAGPQGEIQLAASVVVGADGSSSTVARHVGIRHEQLSLLQAIVARPPDLPPGTSRVWFTPHDTRYFFWMIPNGSSDVAVGLIADDPSKARPALDRFLEKHDWEARMFQAARVPRYRRWVPIHRRWEDRDVYLVGDAAAQVKVSTVGGVVTGLRGAAEAARMIVSDEGWMGGSLLRFELGLHALIRRSLHGLDEIGYSQLVGGLSTRTSEALGASSRDAALLMLARSIVTSPRIALLGMKGLLRGVSA